MENSYKVRYGWLKLMYWYTALVAGLLGFGMIIIPGIINSIFSLPSQDPIFYGIVAGSYLAFGLVSLLGLKAPLKFVPVLLVQMTYKIIWFIGTIIPLLIKGVLPSYSIIFIVVFASFITGDIVAIPFRYLFSGDNK